MRHPRSDAPWFAEADSMRHTAGRRAGVAIPDERTRQSAAGWSSPASVDTGWLGRDGLGLVLLLLLDVALLLELDG
jgi:hypothetical protein